MATSWTPQTSATAGPLAVADARHHLAGPSPDGPVRPRAGSPGSPEPRTWRLELPAGLPLLSLNGRLHWAEQRRRARGIKDAAWALAKQQKIPPLASVRIDVQYQPPDRRRRDHDNVPTVSGKHAIDGIVLAGVLPDDCPPYVSALSYAIGPVHPGGRLVLTITEVPGGDA